MTSTVARVEIEVEHFTTIGFLIMLRATEEQTKELNNIEPYLGLALLETPSIFLRQLVIQVLELWLVKLTWDQAQRLAF